MGLRPMTAVPLLRLDGVTLSFGAVEVLGGLDLEVREGEFVALVGPSGCGKTTLLNLCSGWLSPSAGRVERPARLRMVFQQDGLFPWLTVDENIRLGLSQVTDPGEQRRRADALLDLIGLAGFARSYPHQLSGGMRQRVLIAMALVMNPSLLIADEPTTALDVTIQAQILELLADLQQRLGLAVLLITHDLGVVAEVTSRVLVMYGGQIVERAPVRELFRNPRHPYTRGLLEAMPRLGRQRERLTVIPGTVPPPTRWPSGCRFRDRCPWAWQRCADEHPPEYLVSDGHNARCHLVDEPARDVALPPAALGEAR